MTTKRSLVSSSRSYSSPATYSPTLLIILTRILFLLLPSPFLKAIQLLFPVAPPADDLLDGVEPLGEEVRLLGSHREATDHAAHGPGVLVRLEAADADVARPHPLDVLALEDEAVVPHRTPARGDRDLVGRLDLQRDDGLAPALNRQAPPRASAPGSADPRLRGRRPAPASRSPRAGSGSRARRRARRRSRSRLPRSSCRARWGCP